TLVLLPPKESLATEYAQATVGVLAGGLTLYEACAAGLPAVGVSIVAAQRKSVEGLARRGGVVDGGTAYGAKDVAAPAARLARLTCQLLDMPNARVGLGIQARRLVDGRGVARVAAALRDLQGQSVGRAKRPGRLSA